jgi:thioredoxin-like negative regulator of GroEL
MLLPEPTYQGPENIVYFRANGLEDELQRDSHVTWMVAFFAPWSPSCINFTPIFAKLSSKYHLPNLKFG